MRAFLQKAGHWGEDGSSKGRKKSPLTTYPIAQPVTLSKKHPSHIGTGTCIAMSEHKNYKN